MTGAAAGPFVLVFWKGEQYFEPPERLMVWPAVARLSLQPARPAPRAVMAHAAPSRVFRVMERSPCWAASSAADLDRAVDQPAALVIEGLVARLAARIGLVDRVAFVARAVPIVGAPVVVPTIVAAPVVGMAVGAFVAPAAGDLVPGERAQACAEKGGPSAVRDGAADQAAADRADDRAGDLLAVTARMRQRRRHE